MSKVIFYVLITVFVANFVEKSNMATIAKLVIILGCLEGVYMMVRYPQMSNFGGHLAGNPGYSALLFSAAVLSCVSTLQSEKSNNQKIILTVFLAILISSLLLSRSRAVLIGTIVALGFVTPRHVYLKTLTGLTILITILSLFHPSYLIDYLKISFDESTGSLGRLVIWKSALMALKEKWLFGWGLANFDAAYLQHQQPSHMLLRFSHTTRFAHNDYLQWAVTGGLPSVFFGLGSITIPLSNKREPLLSTNLSRWAFSILVMYAIAALFSFPFFLPFNGLMFFLCFGILLSNGKNKGGIKLDSRVTFPLGVLILTFISVFLFLNGAAEWAKNQGKINLATKLMPYRADLWYQSALQDLNDSSRENMIHQQIVSKLRLSLKRNPYDPFVWSRLARVLISQKSGNSTEIIKAFNTAIRLGPSHAPFWIDTGFYLYQIGNTKSARDHFHRAATLEPMAPLPRVGLALTYHEINNDHANRLYQTALELKKKEKTNQFYSTYADFLFSIPSSLERR